MDKETRREYFRRYYKENRDKYTKNGKIPTTKRGRPKKNKIPFTKTYLKSPITITFN
tara:strand:+ start:661 stop:831 length:171 start_codon:yes stop_codon:yes gene_type:complete